jgi:hypothetical protein
MPDLEPSQHVERDSSTGSALESVEEGEADVFGELARERGNGESNHQARRNEGANAKPLVIDLANEQRDWDAEKNSHELPHTPLSFPP